MVLLWRESISLRSCSSSPGCSRRRKTIRKSRRIREIFPCWNSENYCKERFDLSRKRKRLIECYFGEWHSRITYCMESLHAICRKWFISQTYSWQYYKTSPTIGDYQRPTVRVCSHFSPFAVFNLYPNLSQHFVHVFSDRNVANKAKYHWSLVQRNNGAAEFNRNQRAIFLY